jgi:hypothetical protein
MKKINFSKKRLLPTIILWLVSVPLWAQPVCDINWDGSQYVIRVSGTGMCNFEHVDEVADYYSSSNNEFDDAPKSIVIEEGITGIGEGVFHFYGVQSISLPSSVEVIGSGAFNVGGIRDANGDGYNEDFVSLTSITVNRYLPPRLETRVFELRPRYINTQSLTFDKSAVTIYIPEGVDKNLFIKDNEQWEGFIYVNKPMTGTTGSPVTPVWEMFMHVPPTYCEDYTGYVTTKIKLSDINSIRFSQTGEREMVIITNSDLLMYAPYNELDPLAGWRSESPIFCEMLEGPIHFGLRNTNTDMTSSLPAAPVTDNNTVKIYPNPADDVLFAEGEELDEQSQVAVYTIDGRALNLPCTKQSGKIQIDTQHLVRGMYLLKLNNQSCKFQKR